MRNAYNVTFVLKSKPTGAHYLECRVRWNSCRTVVALSVGFAISPEGWDAARQLCRPRTYHGSLRIPAAVVNREIGRYEEAARDVMNAYLENGEWPTADRVRHDLRTALGIDRGAQQVSFSQALTDYMREQSPTWSAGTVKKYRSLQHHLAAWQEALEFEHINADKLADFTRYLQYDLEMRDSTILRYHGLMKAFLGWSERKGYVKGNWSEYTPKLKTAPEQIVFLTWDELMTLWNWEPDNEAHSRVRDFFCFCSFSGLRFSDAQNLRWSDITDTEIVLTSIKDVDGLRIDLNDYTQEILGRHVDEANPDNRVFPRITNQVMNRELKLIMQRIGLDQPVHLVYYRQGRRVDEIRKKYELIGTHAARRTFISNALMMGIPATTVMRWTGHSDYAAMKPYIAIADADRRKQMEKFSVRKRECSSECYPKK